MLEWVALPSPGDLSNPGSNLGPLRCAQFLYWDVREAYICVFYIYIYALYIETLHIIYIYIMSHIYIMPCINIISIYICIYKMSLCPFSPIPHCAEFSFFGGFLWEVRISPAIHLNCTFGPFVFVKNFSFQWLELCQSYEKSTEWHGHSFRRRNRLGLPSLCPESRPLSQEQPEQVISSTPGLPSTEGLLFHFICIQHLCR